MKNDGYRKKYYGLIKNDFIQALSKGNKKYKILYILNIIYIILALYILISSLL